MIYLPWLKSALSGIYTGLVEHVEDARDLSFDAHFGAANYQPKHTRVRIPTLSIKNQNPLNTCVWNSLTVQKEVAEKTRLSVPYIVSVAKSKGRVTGNGIASLRDAQQTLIESGICEESLLPDNKTDWAVYSSANNITMERAGNASLHKASRYFIVRTQAEMMKAIDDGLVVQTGMMWKTGYRAPSAPFILNIGSGTNIMGHAFDLVGYDTLKAVWIFQNSFGPLWGDKGDFYVRFKDWSGFPGYVSVDVEDSKLLAAYEGKDVKTDDSPAIYRVEAGKRRPFLDQNSFFRAGGRFGTNKTWITIPKSIMNLLPVGSPMP